MARGSAALKLIQEAPEPLGDYSLTQEAIASWSAGQRKCRSRKRHNWGPYTVYEHPTWLDVVEMCSHCRNRRHAPYTFTAHGVRKADKWKPDYRDGYLLPKGAARLDDDTIDELTASDILSRKRVVVSDEED
jgi:hypothetical protein